MSEAAKRRGGGLGRGLSALLGDASPRDEAADGEAAAGTPGVRLLPVGSLAPHPDQPRRHFDEAALEELAQSIAARGLIQPIVVRPHGSSYQIVAGERRWRAAQRAHLHEVPVIVRDFDEAQTLEVALLENIQRQDLNAIEEAEGYRRLIAEFGHTQDALAKIVHKSRSHLANMLRLLELPAGVQARVVEGALSFGHARALAGAADAEAVADQVVARGLSVRDTEKLVRAGKAAPRAPREGAGAKPPVEPELDLSALENQLADLLGVSVSIRLGEGDGQLTLGFSTFAQLDMLFQRLSGEGI